MDVSVIIPAFNAQKTIEYCLNSCLSQIDYIKEIIIVDDHSTDKTIEVVKRIQIEFPNKIFLFENIEKGSNSARNYGFSRASGRFIQWLDADDELGNEKLKRQVEFLNKNTQFDLAYSDWILKTIDVKDNEFIEIKKEKQTEDFLLKLLLNDWLPPHCYLLRFNVASKIVENAGWNPNSKVFQDREFFTIGALLGFKFGYVEKTNVIYYRYLNLFSVSKATVETKKIALYNLVERINEIILINKLTITKKEKNTILSLELMMRFSLEKSISVKINPFKINWRIFPGIKSKLMFVLMLIKNRKSNF
jgi:glycosyltransferase involved in cell wall biosynthesis